MTNSRFLIIQNSYIFKKAAKVIHFSYICNMNNQQDNTYIFGIHSLNEALRSGETIDKVFLIKGLSGKRRTELLGLLKKHGIPFSFVPVEKLEKLSKGQNHQGVVARISPISYTSLDELLEIILHSKTAPLLLLLDGITDVRNFGAIIRTASCTGVQGIIIPENGSAPLNAITVKTSAGAAFEVPICKVKHLKDAVFALQSTGMSIIAASEKASETIYEADLNKPLAIIMGSEERGIQPSLFKLANQSIKLPITGNISSLNVSVACGAILYEVVRQRGFMGPK
jgi:23S rRNA (guanosine2251-2'-O)-methyltransferase